MAGEASSSSSSQMTSGFCSLKESGVRSRSSHGRGIFFRAGEGGGGVSATTAAFEVMERKLEMKSDGIEIIYGIRSILDRDTNHQSINGLYYLRSTKLLVLIFVMVSASFFSQHRCTKCMC